MPTMSLKMYSHHSHNSIASNFVLNGALFIELLTLNSLLCGLNIPHYILIHSHSQIEYSINWLPDSQQEWLKEGQKGVFNFFIWYPIASNYL